MEIEYKILEKKYQSLPHDIKLALSSVDTSEKLQEIANRYNFLLDQSSELFDLTSDVMLGLSPSKDFIENISLKMGVDYKKATIIANDINKEIFGPIRESLQKIQSENELVTAEIVDNTNQPSISIPTTSPSPKPLSSLEKAGNFEIVKDKTIPDSTYKNESDLNKEKILNDIENPPVKASIVDHLLANPVVNSNEVSIQTKKSTEKEPTKSQTTQQSQPKKPYTDPYREPIG